MYSAVGDERRIGRLTIWRDTVFVVGHLRKKQFEMTQSSKPQRRAILVRLVLCSHTPQECRLIGWEEIEVGFLNYNSENCRLNT